MYDDLEMYDDPTPDYEIWERNQLDLDMAAERDDELREHADAIVYQMRSDDPKSWTFEGTDEFYDSYNEAFAAAIVFMSNDDRPEHEPQPPDSMEFEPHDSMDELPF